MARRPATEQETAALRRLEEENEALKRRLAAAEALVAQQASLAAALRSSETRHRLLVDSWTQAVWETDAAGGVTADSASWRAYTGQTLSEWLGYGWLDAIHPADRAHAERQWRETVAVCGLVNAEFRLRSPGGGWRWTNVRAAPVIGDGGRVEKWVGFNIDIEDRKRAEDALRESESKYRKLVDSMDEACAVVDVMKDAQGEWSDFRFVQVNPAFIKQTGMPYPVGKTATQLLGTPNPRWAKLYGEALDTDRPLRVEEEEATLGRIFDLNIFAVDIALSRVAVIFADITGRKKAERALRESEERQGFLLALSDALRPLSLPAEVQAVAMRLLAERLDVEHASYFELEGDGNTFHLAGRFERNAAPMPERMRLSDFSPALVDAFRAGRTLMVADTSVVSEFVADPRPYQAIGVGAWAAVPLMREGRLVAWIGVHAAGRRDWSVADLQALHDVAERTWGAAEVARVQEGLRQADIAKTRFLAILSHELRNPLAAISGAAELLAGNSADKPHGSNAVEIIGRQTRAMKLLLDDLLDVTRLNVGRIELRRAPMALDDLVHAALENVQPQLSAAGHALTLDLPVQSPRIEGDALRLTQVVANLLGNAIKYTPPGGRIHLGVSTSERYAVISVADNGIGIEPAEMEPMFAMFSRGRQGDPRQEGLGVGLALARSIARLHGGQLRGLSGGQGQGSEFVLELPLASHQGGPAAIPTQKSTDLPVQAHGSVLVVDDNADVTWALGLVLMRAGWRVFTATSGAEALAGLARCPPDAAVLDIGLPDMSGHDLARTIRREPWGGGIALIAATGWGQPADQQASSEAGFDMHLTKPIDAKELLEALAELVSTRER